MTSLPPPQIGRWFAIKGWSMQPFQRECMAAYLAGQSGLVNAPTAASWAGPWVSRTASCLNAEGESRAPALWEYLPGTSTWQRRADFAGEPRRDGLSFAANGLGYYGAGQNLASVRGLKDIWEYNSTADRWLRFTDYPGTGNILMVAQPLGTRAYVGLGVRPNAIGAASYPNTNDFWELQL